MSCTTSGNVLNSVNVSASIVSERIKKSKCAGLARVAALLSEHAPDLTTFLTSSQGRHLPVYLQELAADLIAERDAASAELAVLRGNVEHIKEIVAMQQSYARRGGVTDMVDIRTLVEDSLRMNEGAFSRHGVTLVRDFQEVPLITVDKHKVLQILVNVIRNAKYACDESGSAEKRVTVRVRAVDGTMLIAVIDTGVGIPPENLERIFSHGFTTRKERPRLRFAQLRAGGQRARRFAAGRERRTRSGGYLYPDAAPHPAGAAPWPMNPSC